MRRYALATLAAVAAMLLLPTAAGADAVVTFHSPAPDALVKEPTPLVVDVERRLIDPHPEQVTLHLSADGVDPVSEDAAVDLECVEGCAGGASETTSRWAGAELDPDTLAPFASAPMCNGRWWLLPDVTPGPTEPAAPGHGSFILSQPGSAVSDLTARVEGRDVVLTWRPAPEDDVAGYLVERRSGDAEWQQRASLDPGASGHRDTAVADGTYDYRVVTVRPDGFQDGEPAVPCQDTGTDLRTSSSAWRVTLSAAGGDATPTQTDGEDSQDPSGGEGGNQGADGAVSGGTDADAGTGNDADEGGSATSDTGPRAAGSSSARQRIAAGSGDGSSLAAPGVATPADEPSREHYFGEGGPFDEQLDYAGVEGIAADREEALVTERVPGGVIEVLDRELDIAHILPPIATGLVLIALGLHLRRWVRT
ncbi:MAG: hypothetical protein R3320_05305 [Nitriliruptorales bacterium]|nr:hypothetical protein [Nitriliruptorales bacterium]